ncbi:MAG: BMP family ABC transporter substrate-binding protein, partial [Brevinema sp.]
MNKKILATFIASFLILTACAQTSKKSGNKRAVLIVNTNLGDKSFGDLVWKGVSDAGRDFGIEVKAVELMGDPTRQEPTLTELADSGEWDYILSGTFNLKEATEQAAKTFPDQKFINFDVEVDFSKGEFPNMVSVLSKQNEGSFLAGAMAAYLTKDSADAKVNGQKVIGFVAGNENAAINDFLIGYIEGAKYVDPETKILFSYIVNFT